MKEITEYKLIVFDADGTLTPFRDSECGKAIFELLSGVYDKCTQLRKKI